jgi:hypothetical protein
MLIYLIIMGGGVALILASIVWYMLDAKKKRSLSDSSTKSVSPQSNASEPEQNVIQDSDTGTNKTVAQSASSAGAAKIEVPVISDMLAPGVGVIGEQKNTSSKSSLVVDSAVGASSTETSDSLVAVTENHNEEEPKIETESVTSQARLDQATEAYIAAEKQTSSVFDDAFRDELRNRGRLHFEKIISENAMFLQQDLRLTTSQLNEFMKDEIKRVLKDEFTSYEESISSARDLALESIKKTQDAIESQRAVLEEQLTAQVAVEKTRIIDRFTSRMTEIVSHHIVTAFGDELQLDAQMEYILRQLEDNKAEIIEDVRNAA